MSTCKLMPAMAPPVLERRPRITPRLFPSSIEDVDNWSMRLNAMVKRLIMNKDVMSLCSIFAWGRMTVTIKYPGTNETMELWKPKRVDIIALFAHIFLNRHTLFSEYEGYDFIFEDATSYKVTVTNLGGPEVNSDFVSLQRELDQHWGAYKRRICPALRQPHLVSRLVFPTIFSENIAAPHLFTSMAVSLEVSKGRSSSMGGPLTPKGIEASLSESKKHQDQPSSQETSPLVSSNNCKEDRPPYSPQNLNLGMLSLLAAAEILDRQEQTAKSTSPPLTSKSDRTHLPNTSFLPVNPKGSHVSSFHNLSCMALRFSPYASSSKSLIPLRYESTPRIDKQCFVCPMEISSTGGTGEIKKLNACPWRPW